MGPFKDIEGINVTYNINFNLNNGSEKLFSNSGNILIIYDKSGNDLPNYEKLAKSNRKDAKALVLSPSDISYT